MLKLIGTPLLGVSKTKACPQPPLGGQGAWCPMADTFGIESRSAFMTRAPSFNDLIQKRTICFQKRRLIDADKPTIVGMSSLLRLNWYRPVWLRWRVNIPKSMNRDERNLRDGQSLHLGFDSGKKIRSVSLSAQRKKYLPIDDTERNRRCCTGTEDEERAKAVTWLIGCRRSRVCNKCLGRFRSVVSVYIVYIVSVYSINPFVGGTNI